MLGFFLGQSGKADPIIGPNLYPNFELVGGGDIVQDVPVTTLPTGHALVFNTSDPCDATYEDLGDGDFSYIFNSVLRDPVRLVMQTQVQNSLEVGTRYRYQAMVRSLSDDPSIEVRGVNIAGRTGITWDDDQAETSTVIADNTFRKCWIDFTVDEAVHSALLRHGVGVFNIQTTEQETRDLGLYELPPLPLVAVTHSGVIVTHNSETTTHED